jgi:enoyl-[acyl-carrier protein] reductase I
LFSAVSGRQRRGARAPEQLVTTEDVGVIATGLVSDFARNVTGAIANVDAGDHVRS